MKYIILITLCGILLSYILYHAVRMRKLIILGTAIAEQAIPYTQSPDQPTMNILFVGDSTAVGTGASSPSTSLAGLAGARYPNARIDNVSVNGAKLQDAIQQLEQLDATFQYDILFLHIGGNDIVRRTPLDTVRSEYDTLLTMARQKATYVLHTSTGNVGTAPFFPRIVGYYYTHRTKQVIDIFFEELETRKDPNIRYTYLYTSRANDPFLKDIDTYYLPDYFHPSDAGYALWWKHMIKELDLLST